MTDEIPGIAPQDEAFMRSLYQQPDDYMPPEMPGFDAEAGLERLRAKMVQMRQDPAEARRIEQIVADADALPEGETDGLG